MLTRQQIPNLLTFARLLAVPLCLAIMLRDPAWKGTILLGLFVFAALTDFLDGYLARRWQVISPLGTMLDPIADKLLVALMLVYLLIEGGIAPAASGSLQATQGSGLFISAPLFLPVVIILLRELYISGLREFMAARRMSLPVSTSGKLKTALQMLAITALLVQMAYQVPAAPLYCYAPFTPAFSAACGNSNSAVVQLISSLGAPLLYASALLAFTSAVSYTRAALRNL